MPPSGKDCHDSDQCEAGPLVIIRLWQRAAHHLPRQGLRLSAIGQVALTWDSARRSVVNACLAPSRGVDTRGIGDVLPQGLFVQRASRPATNPWAAAHVIVALVSDARRVDQ